MEVLKLQVLEQLECPVCKEYLIAPIKQCASGHSVCGTCMLKLAACPLCKAVFTETRNYIMEALIEQMKTACPDCKEKLPLRGDNHKFNCSAETIKCQLTSCEWSGKRGLIVQHFNDKHKSHIVNDGSKHKTHQVAVCVLQYKERYFWVRRFCAEGQYFWTAQDIFGREGDQKFHFTIKVKGADVVYKFTQPCAPNSQPDADMLKKENFIGIHRSLVTGKNADIYINITDNINRL